MKQRIHRPQYLAIHRALISIFRDGQFADRVIDSYLKSEKKWGSRDRRFFAETVYDIVRWVRRLAWSFHVEIKSEADFRSLSDEDLHQFISLYLVKKEIGFASEWAPMGTDKLIAAQKRYQDSSSIEWKVSESISDWLADFGYRQLGERWHLEIASMNQIAEVYLRPQLRLTTAEQLQKDLRREDIETDVVNLKNITALKLHVRKNVFNTLAYKSGQFEVQDLGSQLIAPYLEAKAGQRVIDACAGAGGKSLHLADLMRNKGKVIAMDISSRKLEELKKRSSRGGVDIIETRCIDSNKVIKRLSDSCDRLLLDVPCSGSGVFKRQPQSKWYLNEKKMSEILNTQKEILSQYSSMLKKDGILVYATCSIWPSENEIQIQEFLNQDSSFELLDQFHILPSESSTDGFFAAKLLKKS